MGVFGRTKRLNNLEDKIDSEEELPYVIDGSIQNTDYIKELSKNKYSWIPKKVQNSVVDAKKECDTILHKIEKLEARTQSPIRKYINYLTDYIRLTTPKNRIKKFTENYETSSIELDIAIKKIMSAYELLAYEFIEVIAVYKNKKDELEAISKGQTEMAKTNKVVYEQKAFIINALCRTLELNRIKLCHKQSEIESKLEMLKKPEKIFPKPSKDKFWNNILEATRKYEEKIREVYKNRRD